ncbi:MAG: ribbon-helix-helix domain-containing protein [Deltaproteobacteria bacterium]|nr:ribbon-helix-helix domain-containing protein [Deltaproteobacteria bacterium]
MTRLQVILTNEQDDRLAKLAQKRRISKARLVREGIDRLLRQDGDNASDPLLDLIGQAGRIGRRDVSHHHDAYLAMAERARNQ